MKKRRAVLLFGSMLALYPVSYLVVSRNGAYDARLWGLAQGPNNTAVLLPKFGYQWYALPDASSDIDRCVEWFYLPMEKLDRKLWHKDHDSLKPHPKYPMRNQVDPEKGRSFP